MPTRLRQIRQQTSTAGRRHKHGHLRAVHQRRKLQRRRFTNGADHAARTDEFHRELPRVDREIRDIKRCNATIESNRARDVPIAGVRGDQHQAAIRGMAAACIALDFPVVSGNVSLYNETNGVGILPTPAIGGVGVIADYARQITMAFKNAGEAIVLIGRTDGHLGQSLWLREVHGREEGPPPPVDLAAERRTGELVSALIAAGQVTAVHDCADGGAAVALAEMALVGKIGMTVITSASNLAGMLFGEDQGRYIVTTRDAAGVIAAAVAVGVDANSIGMTGGDVLVFDLVGRGGPQSVALAALRTANEEALPAMLAG